MNAVMLIGNLTKDIDLRYTAAQMAVASFTIAVNRPTKEGGADFPKITVFGKQAENCERYLRKGSKVAVEGRLQTGSYEDKNGNKVYTTDVIAYRIQFLSPKNGDFSEENQRNDKQTDLPTFEALNEDVPF